MLVSAALHGKNDGSILILILLLGFRKIITGQLCFKKEVEVLCDRRAGSTQTRRVSVVIRIDSEGLSQRENELSRSIER